MFAEEKILIGCNENTDVFLLPKLANRHGLIAGATGTGKTVTLKVLAESFSDLGVPVFLADMKGDVSGLAMVGSGNDFIIQKISITFLSANLNIRLQNPKIRNPNTWRKEYSADGEISDDSAFFSSYLCLTLQEVSGGRPCTYGD